MAEQERASTATTTGHAVSAAGWLDVHYEACRPEYEAMLRAVGLQPGWRVLDAGSGGGSFLPLLAELVGPTGHVTALDLDPGNVAASRRRLVDAPLACPVVTTAGSVLALPFPDAHFDAAWCANVAQYWDDAELAVALAELRRVVRPGGLVALKDADLSPMRVEPAVPFLFQHLLEVGSQPGSRVAVQFRGLRRGPTLRQWLDRAGLRETWLRTWLIEMWAPLSPAQREFWRGGAFGYLAGVARELPLPEPARGMFQRLAAPDEVDRLLDDPAFYGSDPMVLAVGRVPPADG